MITNLLGFVFVVTCILLGILISGGEILAYFSLVSVLIVFGCSIGVIIIIYGTRGVVNLFNLATISFQKEDKVEKIEMINLLIDFASKSRKDGILVLEQSVDVVKDSFFKKGINLLIDGVDADVLRDLMQIDNESMEERHSHNRRIFQLLSTFSPAFGLMGTIIGLVIMLSNLDSVDASVIGSGMATAIITTFYGSFLANAIWIPIDERLEILTYHEKIKKSVIIEGLISIQNGDHPRIVLEKLLSYYPKELQKSVKNI